MSLSNTAMLVRLTVKHPSFSKTDLNVSQEVADNKKANDNSVRVIKTLIDTKHHAYKAVKFCRGQAYNRFRDETAPWGDNGERIIKASAYDRFTKEMREIKDNFDVAVEDFLKIYPTLVDQAPALLGDLFDANLYPSVEDCRDLFSCEIEVRPVPEGDDFRVEMSAIDKQKIVKQIENKNNERLEQVTSDCFKRTHAVLERMINRLDNYNPEPNKDKGEKRNNFHDSLVENVRDLVDILPGLNVANDPRLDDLVTKMGTRLVETNADQLKQDTAKRSEVADHARDIMDQLNDFME